MPLYITIDVTPPQEPGESIEEYEARMAVVTGFVDRAIDLLREVLRPSPAPEERTDPVLREEVAAWMRSRETPPTTRDVLAWAGVPPDPEHALSLRAILRSLGYREFREPYGRVGVWIHESDPDPIPDDELAPA